MKMALFRRHDRKPAPSTEQALPDRGPVSAEAMQALRMADKAQSDATKRARELAPLIDSIRRHLDDNEIAATIGANYVRKRAVT